MVYHCLKEKIFIRSYNHNPREETNRKPREKHAGNRFISSSVTEDLQCTSEASIAFWSPHLRWIPHITNPYEVHWNSPMTRENPNPNPNPKARPPEPPKSHVGSISLQRTLQKLVHKYYVSLKLHHN